MTPASSWTCSRIHRASGSSLPVTQARKAATDSARFVGVTSPSGVRWVWPMTNGLPHRVGRDTVTAPSGLRQPFVRRSWITVLTVPSYPFGATRAAKLSPATAPRDGGTS